MLEKDKQLYIQEPQFKLESKYDAQEIVNQI